MDTTLYLLSDFDFLLEHHALVTIFGHLGFSLLQFVLQRFHINVLLLWLQNKIKLNIF